MRAILIALAGFAVGTALAQDVVTVVSTVTYTTCLCQPGTAVSDSGTVGWGSTGPFATSPPLDPGSWGGYPSHDGGDGSSADHDHPGGWPLPYFGRPDPAAATASDSSSSSTTSATAASSSSSRMAATRVYTVPTPYLNITSPNSGAPTNFSTGAEPSSANQTILVPDTPPAHAAGDVLLSVISTGQKARRHKRSASYIGFSQDVAIVVIDQALAWPFFLGGGALFARPDDQFIGVQNNSAGLPVLLKSAGRQDLPFFGTWGATSNVVDFTVDSISVSFCSTSEGVVSVSSPEIDLSFECTSIILVEESVTTMPPVGTADPGKISGVPYTNYSNTTTSTSDTTIIAGDPSSVNSSTSNPGDSPEPYSNTTASSSGVSAGNLTSSGTQGNFTIATPPGNSSLNGTSGASILSANKTIILIPDHPPTAQLSDIIISLQGPPTKRSARHHSDMKKQKRSTAYIGFSGQSMIVVTDQTYAWPCRVSGITLTTNDGKELIGIPSARSGPYPVFKGTDGVQPAITTTWTMEAGVTFFPDGLNSVASFCYASDTRLVYANVDGQTQTSCEVVALTATPATSVAANSSTSTSSSNGTSTENRGNSTSSTDTSSVSNSTTMTTTANSNSTSSAGGVGAAELNTTTVTAPGPTNIPPASNTTDPCEDTTNSTEHIAGVSASYSTDNAENDKKRARLIRKRLPAYKL